jgi:hypothetical protein
MQLSCHKVQAVFPDDDLQLGHDPPSWVWWDEHGSTFILRVAGLKTVDKAQPAGEAGLFLEVAVDGGAALQGEIEGFAGQHHLPLNTPSGPPGELREQPILAACHIPEKQLFVYCETPELTARSGSGGNLELHATGRFRSRRVPCQEIDLVIHLTAPAMARLLSYFYTLVRAAAGK